MLEPKFQNYPNELAIITEILHEFIHGCPFDIPRYYAISSIPSLININSNSLNSETIKFYLSAAFANKDSDKNYLFGQSLLIISDLLGTENPIVFEEIKNEDQVIEILKKGINFVSEPEYQISSIKSMCNIIIFIPEMHQKLVNSQIIKDIIENVVVEGNIKSKKKVVEAFCRILYSDDSPLQKEILESGILEFLCDSFYYGGDIIEIVDVFNRLVSMPEPLGTNCANFLIEYGLIQTLEDSIQLCEESSDQNNLLIEKEEYLKNFLLDIIQNSCNE